VADAIERREPVLTTCHGLAVNDAGLQAQPNRRLDDKRTTGRSMIDVPMLKDDELIGAFSIYRQEVRPFTEQQIALLTNFAVWASAFPSRGSRANGR
jgi:hypothetical protein